MQIFISWSGDRSKAVATALRDWLPRVIQILKPWISAKDIDKGARWPAELSQKLRDTNFGLICLTPENLDAPWLLFEAGAISKAIEDSFVCPILLDLEPTNITGPLSQFQLTRLHKNDMFGLLETINRTVEGLNIPEEQLRETFDLWWPKLEASIHEIPSPSEESIPKRDLQEMTEEILETVRLISRQTAFEHIKRPYDTLGVALRQILVTLTPRQEKILRLIYGFSEAPKSVDEIAQESGLPLEDIEAAHAGALKHVANPKRIKHLLRAIGQCLQE
jgi:hypothetical protein